MNGNEANETNLFIPKIIILGDTCIGKTKMYKYVCYNEDVDVLENSGSMDDATKNLLNLLGHATYGVCIYTFSYKNNNVNYNINFWELAGKHRGNNWISYYNKTDAAIIYYKNENVKEYYTKNVRRLVGNETPIVYVKVLEKGGLVKENINDDGTIYLDIGKKNFYKIPVLKLLSVMFNTSMEDDDMKKYIDLVEEHKTNYNASEIFATIVSKDDGYIKN